MITSKKPILKSSIISFLFLTSLMALLLQSCHESKEFDSNNLKGFWTIGELNYMDVDITSKLGENSMVFNESDSVGFPPYNGMSMPFHGKYTLYRDGAKLTGVLLEVNDTIFSGYFEITWTHYIHHPKAADSILMGLAMSNEKTAIWLNGRLSGWY